MIKFETEIKFLPHQVENKRLAIERFKTHKGFLISDKGGSGKTFSALHIAEDFEGKILILVPDFQNCHQWQAEALKLFIDIYILKDTKDSGEQISITTYANFRDNDVIKNDYSLIICDECHYLLQNEKGQPTLALERLHAIGNYPKQVYQAIKAKYPEPEKNNTEKYNDWRALCNRTFTRRINKTKVLLMSATPFAYHKSVELGDGLLFKISQGQLPGKQYDTTPVGDFLIKNFGYRLRFGKCTTPEANVDQGLLERNFFENCRAQKKLTSTIPKLNADYSRDFIQVKSTEGIELDRCLAIIGSRNFKSRFPALSSLLKERFKGLYLRKLLEGFKANVIKERIIEHQQLGRKVLVFHQYNNNVISHPFQFDIMDLMTLPRDITDRSLNGLLRGNQFYRIQQQIALFKHEFYWMVNLELDLRSTLDIFKSNFEDVGFINGTVNKKKRAKTKDQFNDGNLNLLVVQTNSGRNGLNLDDQVGTNQRVIMSIGLEAEPTALIQKEARILRQKTVSNAIYEYITTGTGFELNIYSRIIAKRSTTAENLSNGAFARNLDISFREGYLDAKKDRLYLPNKNQGVGGYENDKGLFDADPYENAKTFFYIKAKGRKKEGTHFFATPEPLAYKMVEWTKGTERMEDNWLEPSCGDGAIIRFFPDKKATGIEPSSELASRSRILSKATIENMNFEDYHVINKHNKIVMNPPFGRSGKTALEHFHKVISHLPLSSGRSGYLPVDITILVPNGIVDKVIEMAVTNTRRPLGHTGTVLLPSCTFKNAGTKVNCTILKFTHRNFKSKFASFDLTHCNTLEELFIDLKPIQL